MKVLLIDPVDSADAGPWAAQPWDLVVDVGMDGAVTYDRWAGQLRCPVITLGSLRSGLEDFRRVRDILGVGCGRLIDEYGLDWWEIMSILLHEEVETLTLLQRFVQTLGSDDEVHISRPSLHASILQELLGARAKVFSESPKIQARGLQHYLRVSRKLSTSQIIDIFGDKYDSGYQFRGRFARRRKPSPRPVVLVPTAYVNVSRTGIAYANTFSEQDFLFVATRRSGWIKTPPRNVATAWLSSYAAVQRRSGEYRGLETRFRSLLQDLARGEEFEILTRLGYLDDFPRRFRHELQVRDAWRNVLDSEPVQGVLCSDDSNPYTRIPLLLARERGLPNIACHHGALDGRYIFKRSYADVIWAKGKMEQDYLVRRCGVPHERVEIGAPALAQIENAAKISDPRDSRRNLVFFSELYEVSGGRLEGHYRDMLPPLAELAAETGHRLVVKLHPTESRQERLSMIARVLSADQMDATEVISGPLTDDFLAKTWCGVTILSTVTVECAIRGIPCFLCKWLEGWPYGYVEQFIRFGAGIGLNSPAEIANIPTYLRNYTPRPEIRESCWQPVAPGRLREMLTASRKTAATAVR